MTLSRVALTAGIIFIGLFTIFIITSCLSVAEARPSNWDRYCLKCHGLYGDGKTALGKKLGLKDLAKADSSPDEVRAVITAGRKKMPGYGNKLSQQEVSQLVEFVLNLRTE